MRRLRPLCLLVILACDRTIARFAVTAPGAAQATVTLAGTLGDGTTASSDRTATAHITVALSSLTSSVAGFRVSNSDSFDTQSALLPASASPLSWTLSDGDGTKTVSVQLVNSAGATTIIASTIVLDTQPPLWRSFAAAQTYVSQPSVIFDYQAADAIDSNADLSIAFDPTGAGVCTGLTYVPYGNGTATFALPPPYAASYTFDACVRDRTLNAAPFLAAGQTPNAADIVYYNGTKPVAPLVNPPSTSAGAALIAWTDTSSDSVSAEIDYSTDPNFGAGNYQSVTTSEAERGACKPRVAPPTSTIVSNLSNLSTWYFRVSLTDCYGNVSDYGYTQALIGETQTTLGANGDLPLQLFRDGSDLWAVAPGVTYTADAVSVGGSQFPPEVDGYSDYAKIYHCRLDTSECLAAANWVGPTAVRLGPIESNYGVTSETNNAYDFYCDRCSPHAPRVSLVAAQGRLLLFAALDGLAPPGGDPDVPATLHDAVIVRSCTSNCDMATSWDSGVPQLIESVSTTTVFGPPAAAVVNGAVFLAYAREPVSGGDAALTIARCASNCQTASNWTLNATGVSVLTPAIDPTDGLATAAAFAPTATATNGRLYVGAAATTSGTAPCAHASLPTLLRCANSCSSLPSDLQTITLDNTANACASSPALAFTPSGTFALWGEYTTAASGITQAIRESACARNQACDHASEFSAALTIASDTASAAPVGAVAALPDESPASGGDVLRVAFDSGGQLATVRCDTSASACTTASGFSVDTLTQQPPGDSVRLAAVSANSRPYFLAVSQFERASNLLSSSVAAPLFSALPAKAAAQLGWQNVSPATATRLDFAPLSSAASSVTLNAPQTSYLAATAAKEVVSAVTSAAAGQSDDSARWLLSPFVDTASAVSSDTRRGPSTLVSTPGHPFLYSLDTTDAGLMLGRCPFTSDCTQPASFTFDLIAAGSDFLESDLALDAPRDWYWASTLPGSAPRLAAIASKSDGSELALFCDLGSDAGGCMSGAWSHQVTLSQNFFEDQVNTPTFGLQHKPSIALSGNAVLVSHDVSATNFEYPNGQGGYADFAGHDAAAHYCAAGVPATHSTALALARGPGTADTDDVSDPSSCFDDASAWGQLLLRGGVGGETEQDIKALSHPVYGWLTAESFVSTTYGYSVPSGGALNVYMCPYFSGSANALTPQDCSDDQESMGGGTHWTSLTLATTNGAPLTAVSLGATSEYDGPSAFADESRAYTMVAYADQQGSGFWYVSVCAAAADPSFQTAWPCASASNWTNIALVPAVTTPVSSHIDIAGSDIVLTFLESDNLYEANCPLALGCDVASNWKVGLVTSGADLAGFEPGFSAGRAVRMSAVDPNGALYVDHAFASAPDSYRGARLSGGMSTLAHGN